VAEEVGIGAHRAAAHAPAQLVELRQANVSARSTISVLAFGMSRPDSMMVVESRISISALLKACMTAASSVSGIWP